MSDMNDWNKAVIEEFRANGGKVAQFGDSPVVILHTIGAKSGELREIPLVALVGDDGGLTVFASKAGAPTNPDWYYNLKANPDITVEYGDRIVRCRGRGAPRSRGAGPAAGPGRVDPDVRRIRHLRRPARHPRVLDQPGLTGRARTDPTVSTTRSPSYCEQ